MPSDQVRYVRLTGNTDQHRDLPSARSAPLPDEVRLLLRASYSITSSSRSKSDGGTVMPVLRLTYEQKFGWKFGRQSTRRGAFENFVDVNRRAPKALRDVDAIACQTADDDVLAV